MTALTAPDLASCRGLYRASHWTTCKAKVLQRQFRVLQVASECFSPSSGEDQVSVAMLSVLLLASSESALCYPDPHFAVSIIACASVKQTQRASTDSCTSLWYGADCTNSPVLQIL